MDRLLKNVHLRIGLGFLIVLLAACNGSSSDTGATSSSSSSVAPPVYSGVTTTLGTRGTLSQSNPAVTSNADGVWKGYWRGEDYPNVVKLPLQFITLKSGQKLGVLVGVPGDADGKPVTGTFPAILTQTAYRADVGDMVASLLPFGAGTTIAVGGADPIMIKRGYVSVTVDVLGSGVSDGEETLLGADEQEAYGEAIDWVVQQSWSNGKIGLAGTSYLSITALLSAEQHKSAVKAVFADAPLGDAWRGLTGTGGLLNGLFMSVWMQLTQFTSVLNGPAIAAYPQYADQINAAQQQHIADVDDFYLPVINSALSGKGYITDDGDFWSVRSPLEHAAEINVPTFIIGGSGDIFQRDEPLLYEQLKRNTNTKLLITWGSHVGTILTAELDLYVPPDYGAPSSVVLLLQWFDKYLKDIDTGAEKLPTVTQWVNGYGQNGLHRYASTTDWPHPLSAPQRFYLHGDMSLSLQLPAAGEATHTVAEPALAPYIAASKSSDGTRVVFTVLPLDGSDCSTSYVQWTLGFAGVLPQPCYSDDTTVEQTQQALKYETAAMTGDFYINGPIQADIWMSSTVTEAALSVRVDDVYPDGTAVPLTNGLMSAAFRAVDESRSRFLKGQMIQPWHPFTAASILPVTPGVVMKVPVEIFPAAALVRIGHKLRIAISASNQSQGVWAAPAQAKAQGGISRIYNDPDHPSSVVLPVVPASVLNL